ncbi:MAG: Rid family hydrolase, partial [Flavobacterium sp.]
MKRENILTGSPWEDKMGYCRAVRIGNILEVSGTVAIVDGEKVKADDAYAQTNNIIERIAKVLEEAGLPLPFCQQRIARHGAFVARVDFLYPLQSLVVEVSGHLTHSTREQREADLH